MDWQCSGCGRHFSFMRNECPYCKFDFTITTGGTQPILDNIASAQCKCVVKCTEVSGMGIIYARRDCPIHGHLHGTFYKPKEVI
jgi:hypothetical protein